MPNKKINTQQPRVNLLYALADPKRKKLLHITHPAVRIFYTRPSKLTDAVIRNCS
jgi:hypothetical protein